MEAPGDMSQGLPPANELRRVGCGLKMRYLQLSNLVVPRVPGKLKLLGFGEINEQCEIVKVIYGQKTMDGN